MVGSRINIFSNAIKTVSKAFRLETDASTSAALCSALLCVGALQCGTAAIAQQTAAPLSGFDPAMIEHVHTAADADHMRTALIKMIWHADGLPASLPDAIGGVPPLRFDSVNIGDAVILTRRMEFGIESLSYFYEAALTDMFSSICRYRELLWELTHPATGVAERVMCHLVSLDAHNGCGSANNAEWDSEAAVPADDLRTTV